MVSAFRRAERHVAYRFALESFAQNSRQREGEEALWSADLVFGITINDTHGNSIPVGLSVRFSIRILQGCLEAYTNIDHIKISFSFPAKKSTSPHNGGRQCLLL